MANSITGSHALSIGIGVKILSDSQVGVTIFEGGRFTDDVAIILAQEGLKAAPETAFDTWSRPLVAHARPYPDGRPDYTVQITFVKVKK